MYFFAWGQISRADRRENLHDGTYCIVHNYYHFRTGLLPYPFGSGVPTDTQNLKCWSSKKQISRKRLVAALRVNYS